MDTFGITFSFQLIISNFPDLFITYLPELLFFRYICRRNGALCHLDRMVGLTGKQV